MNDCDNNENIKERTRQEVGVYQPAQVSCRLSELFQEFRRIGLEDPYLSGAATSSLRETALK